MAKKAQVITRWKLKPPAEADAEAAEVRVSSFLLHGALAGGTARRIFESGKSVSRNEDRISVEPKETTLIVLIFEEQEISTRVAASHLLEPYRYRRLASRPVSLFDFRIGQLGKLQAS